MFDHLQVIEGGEKIFKKTNFYLIRISFIVRYDAFLPCVVNLSEQACSDLSFPTVRTPQSESLLNAENKQLSHPLFVHSVLQPPAHLGGFS